MESENSKFQLTPIEDGVEILTSDKSVYSNRSLQIILHPERVLQADNNSVLWASEHIDTADIPYGRWAPRNKSAAGGDRIVVKNKGTTPGYLTLAQQDGGDILSVKITSKIVGLMCFKESFLCASSQVLIEEKGFPLLSTVIRFLFAIPNEIYRCSLAPSQSESSSSSSNNEGIVFLQSRSQMMHKRLLAGETFQVRSDVIVAYQESCKLNFSTVGLSPRFGSPFIKFEGPGIIYFTSQTTRRANKSYTRQREYNFMQMMMVSIALLVVISMFLSTFIDIQILQEAQDMLEGRENV